MKPTIVIIGGGNSFDTYEEYLADLNFWDVRFFDDSKRWRTSFYKELSDRFEVLIPTMPNKDNAVYEEWKLIFEKFALTLNPENTTYIWHSLGGIFLARYFAENPLQARAIHFVAAPFYPCGSFKLPENLSLLASRNNLTLWHSRDDKVVDFAELAKFQEALPLAKTRVFEDRWHFSIECFDELMEEVTEK